MQVSISQISLFKSCRRAYELRYIEGLVPIQKADALETGARFHKLIEMLNNGEPLNEYSNDNSKELAMAIAYQKYIMPILKVSKAEEWFDYKLDAEDSLIGRVDGIADNGYLVEYKTTSSEITEEYEYNLLWNEQILAYMLAKDVNIMYYVVCRKPTIRQKKNETDEEFFQRMIDWYDEDTDSKIRLLYIERTNEEIQQFETDIKAIVKEMKNTHLFYKCTSRCNMWGRRCEYSSVCLNYNPDMDYIEFERKERRADGVKEN